MRCTIVAQSNVEFIWSSVEHFIKSAYTNHIGDETDTDVLENLLLGKYQLWIAHDGRGIRAAAVTRLGTVPNGRRICFVMACGGEGFDEWGHQGISEIERFAKNNKCEAVRLSGRRGWRAFKKYGYKEPFVFLEKAL